MRDKQFKYMGRFKSEFLDDGLPVISIDTKKKELIGNYRREGRSWRKQPIARLADGCADTYAAVTMTMPMRALFSRTRESVFTRQSDIKQYQCRKLTLLARFSFSSAGRPPNVLE